jgi:DNA-binding response OmpR family regulator
MIEILLYSNKSKVIDKIKKFLNKEEFSIQVINKPENVASHLNRVKLFILDITGKNSKDKPEILNILKNADRVNILKFAILNFTQADFLFEIETKFEDFCFHAQIERELTVRIKSVLLRKDIYPPKNSIVVDGLVLNLDKYELSVNGYPVELTFKEFELLKLLLQNQNKVFTRNKLLSIIWGYDFYGGSRTVDVHIRRLRSKTPPPYNLMLKTIRNVGYMFSPQI